MALNTISQNQAAQIVTTKKLCNHLLNYCATNSNVGLCYYVNNMTLTIHSDAAFVVAPETKSQIAGFFYLHHPFHTTTQNVPILVECKTLKHVVTPAA